MHNDNHDHHHNDHHHEHDYNVDYPDSDNLYPYIDQPNVRVLNAVEETNILKPWDKRLDEGVYLESDEDDQLIIRVPFTGDVKIRSVLLKAGPGDHTPIKVELFANRDDLDFSDVANREVTQELAIVQSREVGEYPVKPAKFSNICSITLFIPASQGADTTQISYLGFLGFFSQRKEAPAAIIYEAQPNPATAEKVPGLKGSLSTDQVGYGGTSGAY